MQKFITIDTDRTATTLSGTHTRGVDAARRVLGTGTHAVMDMATGAFEVVSYRKASEDAVGHGSLTPCDPSHKLLEAVEGAGRLLKLTPHHVHTLARLATDADVEDAREVSRRLRLAYVERGEDPDQVSYIEETDDEWVEVLDAWRNRYVASVVTKGGAREECECLTLDEARVWIRDHMDDEYCMAGLRRRHAEGGRQ